MGDNMTSKQAEKEARKWWSEVMSIPPRFQDYYDVDAIADLIYENYWQGYRKSEYKNNKSVKK